MQELHQEDVNILISHYADVPYAVEQANKLVWLSGDLSILHDTDGNMLTVNDMRTVLHTLEVVNSGIMRSMVAMAKRYDEAMDTKVLEVNKRLESMSYKSMEAEQQRLASKVQLLTADNHRLHRAINGEKVPSDEWGTL